MLRHRFASREKRKFARSRPAVTLQRAMSSILERLEQRQLLALTITPTFASNITSDPNAATIMNTINQAIAVYESTFSADSVSINITFQEGGGLGGSSTFQNTVDYDDYRAALVSHATTTDDATALANLPNTTNNPVNNDDQVIVKTALIRALGLSGGGVPKDSTITLNTSICNLDRAGAQDPTKYDLLAVTCHEIDEAIGFGSALDNTNNGDPAPATIKADDLFRYTSTAGTRSYDTALATQAFFSIDGTNDLARFNQSQNGDFGDWFSTGAHTPQIQDAFGSQGATPNFGVELRRLDVLGYRRGANVTPSVTAASDQNGVEGASKAFDLGSFADSDTGPWNIDVDWGDGSAHTNYFVNTAGALGTQSHTFIEEGSYSPKVTITDFTALVDSKSFNVSVSDPAVVGTGGFALTPVEGADSGAQTVATFTDPGGAESTSNYSAVIDWGDGSTPSAGVISFSGGTFTVKGNHTYAEESAGDHPGSTPYDIKVTISHETAPDTIVHSSATVSDPAVDPTGGFTLNVDEGTNTGDQTVATFTDPGGAEPLSDYSATIDWGDGTATTAGVITTDGSGTYTVTGNHTYITGTGQPDDFGNTFCGAIPPSFNEKITVALHHESADDAIANSSAHISLPAASAHLAGGSLIVVGTVGDDQFIVTPAGSTGAVSVLLNDAPLGTFELNAGGRIIVAALAGNDDVQVAGGVTLPTVLYGGTDNDRLKGSGGPNILCGCDGNDLLIAGNSGDLLVGGEGADSLNGGTGNDILIAAVVIDPITLSEDDTFSHLVNILNGGPVSVADDGAVDVLQGAAGIDSFYYHFSGTGPFDIVHGKTEVAINV